MCFHRDELTWTARAPGKLNLFLEVVGSRDDGFHELETLIVPIQLGDWLSVTATPGTNAVEPGGIRLDIRDCRAGQPSQSGPSIPSGADNLIVRALELLQTRSGCRRGADVELVKRIPLAAGLGGGSSDAAAALRLANRAWRLNWHVDRLAELAAELGCDVPFFLGRGAAVCRGRGERIERLPAMRPLHFVVVKPPLGLSTAEVFRAHDTLQESSASDDPAARDQQAAFNIRRSGSGIQLARFAAGRWGDLRGWMHNRLQAAAGQLTPWARQASRVFGKLDVVAHQLSGSGSAYFGIARHAQHAHRLATILRMRQLGLVYATRSCQ